MVPGQIRTRQKDARQEVKEGAAEARGGRQGDLGHGHDRLSLGIPNGTAVIVPELWLKLQKNLQEK